MAIRKNLVAALSLLACATAMAQATLGTITNVQGVVTATQGSTATTVTTGQAITNGTRFVTTSGGSVTMQLNTGCTVTLQPGQAVTVLQSMSCQELAASVRPVVVTAGGPSSPNPALINGLVVVGGAALVIAGVRELTRDEDVRRDPNISPN
jgi:hypothetical protein